MINAINVIACGCNGFEYSGSFSDPTGRTKIVFCSLFSFFFSCFFFLFSFSFSFFFFLLFFFFSFVFLTVNKIVDTDSMDVSSDIPDDYDAVCEAVAGISLSFSSILLIFALSCPLCYSPTLSLFLFLTGVFRCEFARPKKCVSFSTPISRFNLHLFKFCRCF